MVVRKAVAVEEGWVVMVEIGGRGRWVMGDEWLGGWRWWVGG